MYVFINACVEKNGINLFRKKMQMFMKNEWIEKKIRDENKISSDYCDTSNKRAVYLIKKYLSALVFHQVFHVNHILSRILNDVYSGIYPLYLRLGVLLGIFNVLWQLLMMYRKRVKYLDIEKRNNNYFNNSDNNHFNSDDKHFNSDSNISSEKKIIKISSTKLTTINTKSISLILITILLFLLPSINIQLFVHEDILMGILFFFYFRSIFFRCCLCISILKYL